MQYRTHNKSRSKIFHSKSMLKEIKTKLTMNALTNEHNHFSLNPKIKESTQQKKVNTKENLKTQYLIPDTDPNMGPKLLQLIKDIEFSPVNDQQGNKDIHEEEPAKIQEKKVHFARQLSAKNPHMENQIHPILVLNFVDQNILKQQTLNDQNSQSLFSNKMKQIQRFVKKRKNLKIKSSYSIRNFVKEERKVLTKHKTEAVREWKQKEDPLNKSSYDLREQNITKVLKFVRGAEADENQQVSEVLSLQKVEHERLNSALYNRIHTKISQNIRNKKIDVNKIQTQTMRNVLYLNERIKVQGNCTRNENFRKAMKRLKLTK